MRKSNLQWSFSTSQFLSFKSAQDQGGTQKQYPPGFSQRKLGLDIQGGSQYPITSHHHWQPKDVLSVNQSPELLSRIFPATGQANQIIPATIGSSVGGAFTVSNVSVTPPTGPVVGTTDLKSSPSIATGSCQLTLFYNGSVCVYDSVSPEKAQAIMLLAGNGESKNSTASAAAIPSLPKVQPSLPLPVQPSVPLPRPPAKETAVLNQSTGLSSAVSLPTPVSSLPTVASSSAVEVNPIKPVVAPPTLVKFPEPPKSGSSVGAGGVKSTPSAVPQARKASLARFLEKRKERVTSASPYVVSKNAIGCNTIEPDRSTLPAKFASSTPLPASIVEIL